MQIKKEEVTRFVFEDDMIIYVENPQKFTKILLEFLISEFTKFWDTKSTHGNQLHFQMLFIFTPHKLLSYALNKIFKKITCR